MNTKVFVSIQRWSEQHLTGLFRYKDSIKGIILGDPFCSSRMFEHGDWNIIKFAESANEEGLYVALQTPVYLTPRNFDNTFHLIKFLARKELLDLLLLQDVGLLGELKSAGWQVPVCWSFWGGNRGETLSLDLINFLKKVNVQYIETDKPMRVGPLQEHGMKVIYRLYAPKVATFGRTCYSQYVSKALCSGRGLCLYGQPDLVTTDANLNLTVSGHILEHKQSYINPYPEAVPEYVSIHLKEITDLSGVLKHVSI